MKILVSSDVYASVKPKRLPVIKDLVENGSSKGLYDFSKQLSSGISIYDWTLNTRVRHAAREMKFTNQEVFELLNKSINAVKHTEEYTEYLLDDTFGEKKFLINPPGTLRFFSQDLICFYTGKNWRKIEL